MAPGMHSPAVRPRQAAFWDMHLQSASPSAGGSGTLRGRPARHAGAWHPTQWSFWKMPITTLLSRVLQCCPHCPSLQRPHLPPPSPEPLETLLGCPLYVDALSRRWVTPAQALSTGFSVTCV